MTSILITTSTFGVSEKAPLELLRAKGFTPVLNPFKRKLAKDELLALCREHRPVGIVAGTETIDRQVLEENSATLKVISRVGVGMESIDGAAAEEVGVALFRTPDAVTDAVAELAVSFMLSLLRHVPAADRALRAGKWSPLMGSLLSGKTVGLIGLGRIGRRVAEIAVNGFQTKAIAFDPYVPDAAWPHQLADKAESIEALLAVSDVVSIHIPGSADGPLIGARELSRMKRSALLINTSRGGLIDENALLNAIENGILAGAALDVYEQEPYTGPLRQCDKVVLTMHMGSYAQEARLRMEREAVENLLHGLKEKGILP